MMVVIHTIHSMKESNIKETMHFFVLFVVCFHHLVHHSIIQTEIYNVLSTLVIKTHINDQSC